MRIRTIKPKQSKEVKSNTRELKSEKKQGSKEEDFDSNFQDSGGFSSDGKRSAPVLDSSGASQNLEQVASTAPRQTQTPTETNSKYLESNAGTSYADNKYTDKRYATSDIEVNRPGTIRAAGGLRSDNLIPITPRTQQANMPQSQNWTDDHGLIMPKKKYESIDDGMTKRLPFERRKKF